MLQPRVHQSQTYSTASLSPSTSTTTNHCNMAALDGIFELSSILKTEDLEKSDLNRKRIATQQAINQQENRLTRETEEQDRIVGDVTVLGNKLDNVLSSMEMLELIVSELARHKDKECGKISLNLAAAWKKRTAETLHRSQSIMDVVAKAAGLQTIPNLKALQNSVILESICKEMEASGLVHMTNKNAKAACMDLKEQREGELTAVDQQITAWTELEDKQRAEQIAHGADIERMEHDVGAAESDANEQSNAASQEKFKASVLLGAKTEGLLTLKQCIATERRSIEVATEPLTCCKTRGAALEAEEAALTVQINTTDTATQDTRDRIAVCLTARTELRATLTSLQADAASTKQLLQTTVGQSFQERADALGEDVQQARSTTAAKKAQLATLEDQVAGVCVNEEIAARAVLLQHAQAEQLAMQGTLADLTGQHSQMAQAIATERIALELLMQEASTLQDPVSSAERTACLKALHEQVAALQPTIAAHAPQECLAQHLVEQAQKTQEASSHGAQLRKAAQDRTARLDARTSELAALQQKLTEMNQAATEKHIVAQKQARLSAAHSAKQAADRQCLARMRKALLEDDKVFQEAQQKLSVEFNIAMGALEQELEIVKRKLLSAQAGADAAPPSNGSTVQPTAPSTGAALPGPLGSTPPPSSDLGPAVGAFADLQETAPAPQCEPVNPAPAPTSKQKSSKGSKRRRKE